MWPSCALLTVLGVSSFGRVLCKSLGTTAAPSDRLDASNLWERARGLGFRALR